MAVGWPLEGSIKVGSSLEMAQTRVVLWEEGVEQMANFTAHVLLRNLKWLLAWSVGRVWAGPGQLDECGGSPVSQRSAL